MSKTERIVLALLLAGSLAFRLFFVGHDMRALVMRGPLYDDSFYSFEIARNIAHGLGSTFDGVTRTNGYQPLYVFLLVPVFWICGAHATAPIYAALAGSALGNVLTGWILFRLLRAYASLRAAFFGLTLWAFGPAIVRQAVNGLETSLAMLLVAASLEYYLCVFRATPRPTRRQAATLGALLGLSVFARVDALLFALAVAVDVIVRRRPHDVRRLGVALASGALVLTPWCIGSRILFGSLLPESGSATRYLSEAYAPHDHPEFDAAAFAAGPPARYLAENVSHSLLQLGTSPMLHVFTRVVELGMRAARFDEFQTLAAVGAFLLLLMLAGSYFLNGAGSRVPRLPRDFRFLFLYSALLLAAYSFVVFGQIFYSRYYYPIFFFSVVLGAIVFDLLMLLVRPERLRRWAGIATTAAYAIVLGYMSLHRVQNGNYRFLHVVDWIAVHTDRGAKIGVFNSGAIGYFSDRHIVNLDGKVNPAALTALQRGRISDYIEAEGLDYVIDHEWILQHFLGNPAAAGANGARFARVDGDHALGVPGWAAWRVVHEPSARTGSAPAVASRLSP